MNSKYYLHIFHIKSHWQFDLGVELHAFFSKELTFLQITSYKSMGSIISLINIAINIH